MLSRVVFSQFAIVAVILLSVVLTSSVLGVPHTGSLNNITGTPGCYSDADCAGDRVCTDRKCSDPCTPNICGPNTLCYVANHNPICCGQRHVVRAAIGLGKTDHVYHSSTEKTDLTPARPREKRFYLNTIVKMNWHQAWAYCRSTNMDLAVLDNQQEYEKLRRMLMDISVFADFWLSGSDLGETQRYVWMTTGAPVSYTNWAEGEPNHWIVNGEVEHCIELSHVLAYKMNDELCSKPKYHVCQY